MKLIFLHADKFISKLGIKVSCKVDIIIINGHDQAFSITQSSKFEISLQYLKREVRSGGQFWHADKRQNFSKLVLSFLMEVARRFQNTENRKLVIFLQYIKKKLSQLLSVLLGCKTFRYFTGLQS